MNTTYTEGPDLFIDVQLLDGEAAHVKDSVRRTHGLFRRDAGSDRVGVRLAVQKAEDRGETGGRDRGNRSFARRDRRGEYALTRKIGNQNGSHEDVRMRQKRASRPQAVRCRRHR